MAHVFYHTFSRYGKWKPHRQDTPTQNVEFYGNAP